MREPNSVEFVPKCLCTMIINNGLKINASKINLPNTLIKVEGKLENHFEYQSRIYVLNDEYVCRYNVDMITKDSILRMDSMPMSELEQIISFCVQKNLSMSTKSAMSIINNYYQNTEEALRENKEFVIKIGGLNHEIRDFLLTKKEYAKERKIPNKEGYAIIL